MNTVVYVKMDQSIELTHSNVTIGDVADIQCVKDNIANTVRSIKLLTDNTNGKKRYVVSIMRIIELATGRFENIIVENLGETECVIEFKQTKIGQNYFDIMKAVIICIILFLGAGFSIMSFNNDISVDKMFVQISELIIGKGKSGEKILEIFYAIGLGLGIVVFYNHFGPKKLTKDPTPIEVEMRKYENDINTTLIDGHNRQDGKLDVK